MTTFNEDIKKIIGDNSVAEQFDKLRMSREELENDMKLHSIWKQLAKQFRKLETIPLERDDLQKFCRGVEKIVDELIERNKTKKIGSNPKFNRFYY